ncbi:MAG TPA: S41 family peptidase [Woeseiaceae bacterium]
MRDRQDATFVVRLLGIAALTALAACGSGGGGEPDTGDGGSNDWKPGVFKPSSSFAGRCESPRAGTTDLEGSVLDENNFLRSYSDETYLWYDEIVDQNPASFTSALAYFDELVTLEMTPSGAPKDRFHFTISTDEWERLSQSGESAGYGAQWAVLEPNPPSRVVRVAYTEPDSPATAPTVQLARGADVLTVDGASVANGNANTLNAGLFPAAAGEPHTFTIRDLGSTVTREITMTSAIVTSSPVQNVKSVDTPMGKVGYLLFNDHIATAEGQLIDAVEQLAAESVQHLVVDLRYNGGGFLAIASEFAYMIAGAVPTAGATFEEIRFNDKHPTTDPVTGEPLVPMPFFDETLGFSPSAPEGQPLPSLNLQKVYVLAGPDTCSASESIINSLRGVDVEVVLVGATTCGKPYGFYPTDNCGTTYFTIQFQGFNNQGFGDYGDGFSPQNDPFGEAIPGCSVHDDFDHALGDPLEARFKTALDLIQGGSCPAPTGAAPERGLAKPGALHPPDGIAPKDPWRENRILRR